MDETNPSTEPKQKVLVTTEHHPSATKGTTTSTGNTTINSVGVLVWPKELSFFGSLSSSLSISNSKQNCNHERCKGGFVIGWNIIEKEEEEEEVVPTKNKKEILQQSNKKKNGQIHEKVEEYTTRVQKYTTTSTSTVIAVGIVPFDKQTNRPYDTTIIHDTNTTVQQQQQHSFGNTTSSLIVLQYEKIRSKLMKLQDPMGTVQVPVVVIDDTEHYDTTNATNNVRNNLGEINKVKQVDDDIDVVVPTSISCVKDYSLDVVAIVVFNDDDDDDDDCGKVNDEDIAFLLESSTSPLLQIQLDNKKNFYCQRNGNQLHTQEGMYPQRWWYTNSSATSSTSTGYNTIPTDKNNNKNNKNDNNSNDVICFDRKQHLHQQLLLYESTKNIVMDQYARLYRQGDDPTTTGASSGTHPIGSFERLLFLVTHAGTLWDQVQTILQEHESEPTVPTTSVSGRVRTRTESITNTLIAFESNETANADPVGTMLSKQQNIGWCVVVQYLQRYSILYRLWTIPSESFTVNNALTSISARKRKNVSVISLTSSLLSKPFHHQTIRLPVHPIPSVIRDDVKHRYVQQKQSSHYEYATRYTTLYNSRVGIVVDVLFGTFLAGIMIWIVQAFSCHVHNNSDTSNDDNTTTPATASSNTINELSLSSSLLCSVFVWKRFVQNLYRKVLLNGLQWIENTPIGFKLNHQLTVHLGSFSRFICLIYESIIIQTLDITSSILSIILSQHHHHHGTNTILYYVATTPAICTMIGITFGGSGLLALMHDMYNVVLIVHLSVLYIIFRHMFHGELYLVQASWRLFQGKKLNILRHRTDTMEYDSMQLLLGTIVFAGTLFLFTTILAYYMFSYIMYIAAKFGSFLFFTLPHHLLLNFPFGECLLRVTRPGWFSGSVIVVTTPTTNETCDDGNENDEYDDGSISNKGPTGSRTYMATAACVTELRQVSDSTSKFIVSSFGTVFLNSWRQFTKTVKF